MNLTSNVKISDRMIVKSKGNILDRFLLFFLNDERDLPIAYLILKISLTMLPMAAFLIIGNPYSGDINIAYAISAAYLGLMVFFFAPYVLMLHNVSHRRLFKQKFSLFNYWPTSVLGLFFGQTPFSYYAHHVGMHHSENNLYTDLSSTIKYQRDSAFHFLRYFTRFFLLIPIDLSIYLVRTKKYTLLIKYWIGESIFIALAVSLCMYNLPVGLTILVIPLVIARFGMMAGNWGQHAFVDTTDPNNCYRNSLTCINSKYNDRCFNDGYHISHHLKAGRHWSDHPQELITDRKRYIKEEAIIFEKIDFFMVWLLLMTKRYNTLIKYYVNLDDKKVKTPEQVRELFDIRLKKDPTNRITMDTIIN